MEKRKQYCCVCDTKIEEWIIDERPAPVCPKCSQTVSGYYKEEKDFVEYLREYFLKDNYWQILPILFRLRVFLKKKDIVL